MTAGLGIFAITPLGIIKDIQSCKKNAIGYYKRKRHQVL